MKLFSAEFYMNEPQPNSIKELINQMYVEYDGKRLKMKKGAEAVFQNLKEKLSQEGIEKILTNAFEG